MPDGRDPDPDGSATTLALGSLACDPDALPHARRKPTTVARLRHQMLMWRSWAVHGGPKLVAAEPAHDERLSVPSAHLAPLPPPYALPLPMSESARAWEDAERARTEDRMRGDVLAAVANLRASMERGGSGPRLVYAGRLAAADIGARGDLAAALGTLPDRRSRVRR